MTQSELPFKAKTTASLPSPKSSPSTNDFEPNSFNLVAGLNIPRTILKDSSLVSSRILSLRA
jgi:hypothetical protein